MDKQLEEILTTIDQLGDLSADTMAQARARQEILAKPTGALGRLEDISVQLAGITGKVNNDMKRQAVVILSADNGVVEEGVASAPQSVTLSQTINFTRRLTGVSAMAKYFGIDLLVVDVGVKLPIPDALYSAEMVEHHCADTGCRHGLTSRIVNRRIADGTRNLAKEPAMTREEALRALLTGVEAAEAIKRCGYDVFGVGEMGIGNTTTCACVLAALTQNTGQAVVGRGGGLNDAGLAKKIEIVEQAVRPWRDKAPDTLTSDDILDILAQVGGFDICAMVGADLGAAYYKLPVVIDGYISAVAALSAARLAPKSVGFMFGSHVSKEKGYNLAMEALGVQPYFDLGMRLGEGSGCPISFKILETACATMNGMATFAEGAIDADYLNEGKKGNFF